MISDAVSLEAISNVVGYKVTKGNFQNTTQNLPQRIAIFGEANVANQGSINFGESYAITSAQQAGELFGFGSPIHMVMRILRPFSGTGVAGIPTIVYPQAEAAGATAKVIEITATGVATANTTHTLKIAGRRGVDGGVYSFTVNTGDTASEIHQKIEDAINNVLGCPVSATSTDYEVTTTSKWKGLTADQLNIEIDTNGNDAGINYSINSTASGSGTPSIASSLALIENNWVTVLVNTYGMNTDICNALEAFNGIPDPVSPTGRFSSIIMKPFFAFTGTTAEDSSAFTDSRLNQVTIVACPAPLSVACHWEAAANYAAVQVPQAQNNPHLDIQKTLLPDMPVPESIGAMSSWINRDTIVKKGHSTVELIAGQYSVCDFVTTYHPIGEVPPQFRYVRSMVQDFNIRYKYFLLEQIYVVGKAIASDLSVGINVGNVIRPSDWKQIMYQFADELAFAAITTDAQFMKESVQVGIGQTNPDRFETSFKYKRTGLARIASTTAEAGFNFGV
jgi:phage tail sheath gpL-like